MAKSRPTANESDARTGVASLRERLAAVDPVVLAAGAAVAGAAAGALVPRSAMETQLLAPIGKHVQQAAKSLGVTARQALSAELAGVPIVGPIAVEQIDRVIDSVVQPVAAEPDEADLQNDEADHPVRAG